MKFAQFMGLISSCHTQ